MRPLRLKSIFYAALVLIVLLSSRRDCAASDSPVGDIMYSILPEAQFQMLHGDQWELLRGQKVPLNSDLRQYWQGSHLPDARGVFLRSGNHERSKAEGNPDGDLEVGTYQSDSFKKHNHGGGNHTHTFQCERYASRVPRLDSCENTLAWHPPKHIAHKIDQSGKIINDEGGSETRPRNISVNTFIKIRESGTTPSDTKVTLSRSQLAELMTTTEFKNLLREILNENR